MIVERVFIRHLGENEVEALFRASGDIMADGKEIMQANEELFGKKVGELPDGVYDKDGNFLGTHEEYVKNQDPKE